MIQARCRSLLPIILICCLGIIAYSNTFQSSFHFDDEPSVYQNIHIRDITNLRTIWKFWPTRFVTYFSFALNYQFNKYNVFGYHLANIILHVCVALVVRWFTLLTFTTPAMKDSGLSKYARQIALFAGLLFVAHPIQTQAVTYITQRATLLAAFFYLLSITCYSKSRILAQDNTGIKSRVYYIVSLISATLALLSKEMTITLPFMILLYDAYFFRLDKPIYWKKKIPFFMLALGIPIILFMTQSVDVVRLTRAGEEAARFSAKEYLFTQFRVIVTYLRLFFFPINQNLDYDYPILKTFFDYRVIFSLLSLGVIFALALRLRKKHSLFSFCIFWFFLSLTPESSTLPIKDVILEHRLYLPMVGFSILLSGGIYYCLLRKYINKPAIILTLIVCSFAVAAYLRNFAWEDEFTLWGDAIKKSSHKARPYINRGFAYERAGDFRKALSDYNMAIQLKPDSALAHNKRGGIYYATGNFELALSDFNKALQLKKDFEKAYNNRGVIYARSGNVELALLDFAKAIEIDPYFTEAFRNRAILYKEIKEYEKSRADFQMADKLERRGRR